MRSRKVGKFLDIQASKIYLLIKVSSRLLKNYHQMVIQSIFKDQECLKSPFGKGRFKGISGSYKIPPNPLLEKGGIKTASNQASKPFFNNLLGLEGHPDENIWIAARKNKRVLLTHDDDFLDNGKFPLKGSFGAVVLPHKTGDEGLLIGKLWHLVSILSSGAGFTYERKIVVSADSHWRIISIDEKGFFRERLYDLSDLNRVFLLLEDS